MSSRWSINITPAERAARIIIGGVGAVVGIVLLVGATSTLAIALELTLTGDLIDAERAAALGLVNRVVPPDEVLETALALADRIAANGPLGLQATKQLVRLAIRGPAEYAATWTEWQAKVFGSDDAREGAAAFIEKRDPVWKGR